MKPDHLPANTGYPGLIRFHDPKTGKHYTALGDPKQHAETVKKMIGGSDGN